MADTITIQNEDTETKTFILDPSYTIDKEKMREEEEEITKKEKVKEEQRKKRIEEIEAQKDRQPEYNFDVKITYNTYEDETVADLVYKQELLQVFNIGLEDEASTMFDILGKRIDTVIPRILQIPKLKDCAEKINQRLFSDTIDFGCMLLFSYDTMYLTHQILYLHNKQHSIDEKIYEILEEKINF